MGITYLSFGPSKEGKEKQNIVRQMHACRNLKGIGEIKEIIKWIPLGTKISLSAETMEITPCLGERPLHSAISTKLQKHIKRTKKRSSCY